MTKLCRDGEKWKQEATALRARVTELEQRLAERVPKEPPEGLLISMAVRYDHGLGCPGYYDDSPVQLGPTHAQRLESTISTMRQLYEEVAGFGFYKPEKEASYVALRENPSTKRGAG